ncbi:tudor domain-containing protein 7A-like [Amphibalanus amphitrite]|uniref:tudor domain-containing protein 7A-like n=1 Tax=Amphibalanus amphitrite TaxID=1232801 RepID=UPI001C9222F5|nr:tudor domain-containing protein 7A-like [Amphibalanus amphitrite]XP_043246095.1 tudor domain-containing protein 7A-like [Amphibalanus amphitrite]
MGDETKSLIRSCLISTKGGLTLRELKRDFQTLVGYPIPFRDSGHRSLEDYLRSIPDVVRLDDSGPEPVVQFVVDASTAGIASLVQRQKGSKKKAPPRRPTGYVPRPSYGPRRPGGFSAPRFNFQPRRAINVRPNSGHGLLPTPPRPRWSQPAAVRPQAAYRPPPPPQQQQPQYQQQQQQQQQAARPPVAQPARSPPQQSQPQYRPAPDTQSRWSAPAAAPAPAPAPARAPAPAPVSVKAPTPTPAPARQPAPAPAPVEKQTRAALTPKQELQAFIRQHGLPEAKLETVSFRPKSKSAGRVPSFYSTITVGEVRCQTYPDESPSAELAEDAACKMALEELRQRRQQDNSQRESPVTDDQQLIVTRIAQMLETRRYGLWRDSVPDEYRRQFEERVPDNWEELLYDSGTVRFDCVGADRYILYSAVHVVGPAGEPGSPAPTAAPAGCLTRLDTVQLPDEEMFPVWVTCVLSGSQLAFRLIGEQYTDRLDDLMTEMEVSLVEEQRPVTPVIGGIYLAQVDGTPHRVQVTDILDDMVSAFFVDIGLTELVAARSLRPLDAARFGQLPGQALHASLSGVDGERPGATEALSRLVLRKSLICQVVVAEDSRLEVVLFDTSGEDDVNINQTLQAMSEVEAPPQLPPVGGIVDAFVVHVSPQDGRLFVQLDSSAADEVCQRVLTAGELAAAEPAPAPSAVTPGRLVLARYTDGSWYRARPLATAHGAVPVLFVDYGNEETVPVSELRALPPALARHPPQALPVRLSGVQFNDAAALRLTEMVPDGGTRVVLRVTAQPDSGCPEVDAYKRIDNNELVSINATLQVEAHMSGRPTTSRQSSVSSRPDSCQPPPASVPATPALARGSPSPTEQLQRLRLADPSPPTAGDSQPIGQYQVPRDGDGYLDVTVSCCSSPWNIYVQPYMEGVKLSNLMSTMQKHYGDPANVRPLDTGDIVSGQFCAVKNPEDGVWYRARVETRLDSGEVTIKFIDYGDFSYVPLSPSCVQPLPHPFRQLPGQAVKARLGGVRPAGSDWTIDDCIALQRLLSAEGGGGAFVAELLDFSRDAITREQLIIVRLVDTSGDSDVYVDRLLVRAGNAVHTGEYYTV